MVAGRILARHEHKRFTRFVAVPILLESLGHRLVELADGEQGVVAVAA